MSSNFITKLNKIKNPEIEVKPIFYDQGGDYFAVEKFLKNQKYLDNKKVLSILKIKFLQEAPIGYALMDKKKNILGFLGTIFSKRYYKKDFSDHCYLHSWIVEKKFRLQSFRLILPLLEKNIFITTFSPIKSLEGLYKKFNFDQVEYKSIIFPIFNFNSLFGKTTKFYQNKEFFFKFLSKKDKKIMKDHEHKNLFNFFCYINDDPKDYIYFVGKKIQMYGFLKIIDILYISDHKKYFNHNNLIHNNIARELKTFFIRIHLSANIEHNTFKKSIFNRTSSYKLFYKNNPDCYQFDLLYSELIK